ncbi:MAG: PEP-CTERM sorting domain-containing protein [Gammaproteobacteria bacterium]|nr:PEP-CTERM sorting domain-containing protein [Gammaproteobacteria bacterium]
MLPLCVANYADASPIHGRVKFEGEFSHNSSTNYSSNGSLLGGFKKGNVTEGTDDFGSHVGHDVIETAYDGNAPTWQIDSSPFCIDVTSIDIHEDSGDKIKLEGWGVVHGPDHQDTEGHWVFHRDDKDHHGDFEFDTRCKPPKETPAPATLLLLGGGMVAAGLARRRVKRSA